MKKALKIEIMDASGLPKLVKFPASVELLAPAALLMSDGDSLIVTIHELD